MAFSKGSLLLVDFTAQIKETGEIFDTTDAKVAETNMLEMPLPEKPKLVSVGELAFPVIRGFDEALAQSEVDKPLKVEVPPIKAFGERDTSKIKMVPLRKFDDADKISVGDSITMNSKRGIVRFIGSGRVQVDYNHRYAGKTIMYNATVLKHLQQDEEIIRAILAERTQVKDPVHFEIASGMVTIDVPTSLFRAEDLQRAKYVIQSDIFRFVPGLTRVSFVESYYSKKEQQNAKSIQSETAIETASAKEAPITMSGQGEPEKPRPTGA